MSRKLILIVALAIIFLSVGWLFDPYDQSLPTDNKIFISSLENEPLVEVVEINISSEFRVKLEKDVLDLQSKIAAGDKGEAANLGPLYSTLGMRYDSLGELGKAREAFLSAIKEDPKEGVHWLNLSDTYTRMKAFLHAEDALQQALKLQSGYEEYWSRLLVLKDDGMKADEATMRELFEKALIATKRHQNILSLYASYVEKLGKTDEAIGYWQELVQKYPDNAGYYQALSDLQNKN